MQRGSPLNTPRKIVLIVVFLAVFSVSASTDWSRIGGGPSGAQVAGAAVGAGAVIGIVLYLTLHRPSITGCIRSADSTYTITDQNSQLSYTVVNAATGLKPGERVKLQGKKKKDKSGNLTFRMKTITVPARNDPLDIGE
jgi:hypothetical protein